jgi:hypothetical protein
MTHHHTWKFFLLVILGSLVFLWLIKAPALAAYLSKKIGVEVTARTISVWPNSTTIRYFRIENPDGYRSRTAFEAKKIAISYQFGKLRKTPLEIDEIVLDGVYLNIILNSLKPTDNNWTAIGAKMPRGKRGREVIVHKLILRNMTVKTQGKGATLLGVNETQHFDEMEFNEINSTEGFPTKELIANIFGKAGVVKYLQNFLNPTQRIKGVLNPFNIFGTRTDDGIEKIEPSEEGSRLY